MRNLTAILAVLAIVVTAPAAIANDLKPAKILDVEAYTDRQTTGGVIKGNGAIVSLKHEMYRVVVGLDGMKITGEYEAHWSWTFRASDLVVGTDVQAMVEKDKLTLVAPNGKTLKAKIIRRELDPQSAAAVSGDHGKRAENRDLSVRGTAEIAGAFMARE